MAVVTVSLAALTGLLIVTRAALKAWSGWLDLKRLELGGDRLAPATPAARIDVADLRERVRKLEAIAADIDL